MIRVPSDSVYTGDTVRITWDLPTGSKLLRGPTSTDSLSVKQDTSALASWTLQPLAPSTFGGDTLLALAPGGDTLREPVPRWPARSHLQGSDTSSAPVLPPLSVPVPFPWDVVGWSALGAVVAGLVVWAILTRRRRPKPAPPPPPERDVVDLYRERLDSVISRSEAGAPPRETAFAAGELLRELHGKLHGWTDAVESTSLEWMEWARSKRSDPEVAAVRSFLSEADALRYADSSADAKLLLAEARLLLDTIGRNRPRGPAG